MNYSAGTTSETLIDTAIVTKQVTIGEVLRGYYELTKPGITQMIMLTAAAGYYLAMPQSISSLSTQDILRFVVTILGTGLISSGACAWNHYLESTEDSLMKRTKKRPIPSGIVSPVAALTFAILTSLVGAVLLSTLNTITVVLAIATHISYVMLYTPLKKRSWTAMLLGGIPGALPAMGGWTAATGTIGAGAWILFGIMFIWQMPHFLSLAMMYRKDYEQGGFILVGSKDSTNKTMALHSFCYGLFLVPLSLLLSVLGITGYLYAICAIFFGGYFVYACYSVIAEPTVAKARSALLWSYAFLMGIFLCMFVDKM